MLRPFVFLLNCLPQKLQEYFCRFFGTLLYYLLPQRRRIVLNNLTNVFPQKSFCWRKNLAKVNSQRWVETAWAFWVSSYWSKDKRAHAFRLNPKFQAWLKAIDKKLTPTLILIPHLNLMEFLTWFPILCPQNLNIGVVYRPFRHKYFDNWIRRTRERFQVRLIARNRGVAPLENLLRSNGILAMLFDQAAGNTGVLTSFFGKLASTTDLPGRLAEKFKADIYMAYFRRTGFMRGEICLEALKCEKTVTGITLSANQWLEGKLAKDADFYENWLWLHRRWKTQTNPYKRFHIYQKRNLLPETLQFHHLETLPKKTRVWIRMPNWLGDCVMIYPALKALRKARPDFHIRLVVKKHFIPWLQLHFPADAFFEVPEQKNISYFKKFLKLREQCPDIWINITNSIRSDLEAFCSGALQRFGIRRPYYPRPLLNYIWKAPAHFQGHQSDYEYQFFQHFGLQEPIDKNPLYASPSYKTPMRFACLCGSANTPAKRWPLESWQKLIEGLLEQYPQSQCYLLGSSKERELCAQIATKLPHSRIFNETGQTDLVQLEKKLLHMHFVVANDSGGLHLANFLGIPTVGLFSKTSPTWSQPYFNTPKCILQGTDSVMASLSVEKVYTSIIKWLVNLK